MKPRTPNSPPLMPVNTLSLMTCGALVLVSPFLGFPFLTDQTFLPVLASSATSSVSACWRKIFPSPNATPRFTVSQHMTGTVSSWFWIGTYSQTTSRVSRLMAKVLLGKGAFTYRVSCSSPVALPGSTRGPPSWPLRTPVENVQAACSLGAFPALIWSSFEYRVLPKSPFGMTQYPSSSWSSNSPSLARADAGIAAATAANAKGFSRAKGFNKVLLMTSSSR